MFKIFKKIIPDFLLTIFKRNIFIMRGCIPWTIGYNNYKWSAIQNLLINDDFNSRIGKEKFGYHIDERIVEIPWFLSMLPEGYMSILDVGSALNFLPILKNPKISEKKLYITTLAPESQAFWNMGVSYIYDDIRDNLFKKNSFDVIVSLSTIEHIGLDNTFLYTDDISKNENCDEDYLKFIDIIHGLLKPNGIFYLSFPYGKYKNHKWFQVLDEKRVELIIERFKPKEIKENIFLYANDKWNRSDRTSAADSLCYDINVEKKHAYDYCAFSRSVACLELRK